MCLVGEEKGRRSVQGAFDLAECRAMSSQAGVKRASCHEKLVLEA